MSRSILEEFKALNYNVKLVFVFTILQSLGRGIWMGAVLSAYIFFLADESYALLGITTAASGFALTFIIFPSGYFADKYRRDYLLKAASVIGLAAMGFAFFADTLLKLVVVLTLWGLFQGLNRPSLEAIFADSVATGNRSRIYSRKHSVEQTAMASGPFVNVILFFYFGDEWELNILKSVLFVGISISMISLFSLLFFNDEMSMGEESESLTNTEVITNGTTNETKSTKVIPYFLLLSNLVIGFGAGMTIRFFPIFFLEEYHLKPIGVNFVMGLTAIATGIASLVAQKYSLKTGRAKMIFFVQMSATACLFAIAYFPPLILLVILFVARGALMNASQPLSRSILMDTIKKQHRGKVNALEGIAWGLFWNVSAVLGGYLIEAYSYRVTFLITASVYTFGTLLILFIVPLVSKELASTEAVKSKINMPSSENMTMLKGK